MKLPPRTQSVLKWLRARAVVGLLGTLTACTVQPDDGSEPPSSGMEAVAEPCGIGGNGSTLTCSDGATVCTQIVIPEQRCSFTQSEAFAGIDITYQVVTDEPVDGVFPEPLDVGGCAEPDDSGLIVFEELQATDGGGATFCQCDIGTCDPEETVSTTLPAGSFDRTYHWDGLTSFGPNDPSEEAGVVLDPGLYVLRLRAVGEQERQGERAVFDVGAAMTILITDD